MMEAMRVYARCRGTGDRSIHLKVSSPGENPNRLMPDEPTT